MKSSSKSNSGQINSIRSRPLLARTACSCAPLFRSRIESLEGRVLLSSYALNSVLSFGTNDTGTNPSCTLVADSGGNMYGTTRYGGYYGYGTVFEILKGSGKITTLASFSYTDGRNPAAGVTLDAAGNLFGTTMQGGGDGYESGTVFEIPKGTGRIQTLAYFRHEDFPSGSSPGEVALDQAGNVYGTTGEGGANDLGTVFKVSAGVQTIVSFDGANGETPLAGVVIDPAGNLFGTTALGGPSDDGTVFEIAKGTNTLQTIASFNGVNGHHPGALTLDASGNLFGSTYEGGDGSGVLFEVAKGSGKAQTLALLDYNRSGANPVGHVALDAAGNVYGTTSSGGASGYGTVFKVAKGSATAQPIASFDMTKGFNPRGVVLDSAGNLFGTTSEGGPLGGGVLFEIPKSTGVLQTVAAFRDSHAGQSPVGMVLDASGNQYGTTYYGPNVGGGGRVFMIAKGSSEIQTLVPLDWTHDGNPVGGLTLDAAGNFYGSTQYGGTDRAGTVYKIAKGSHVVQTLASFPANGGMPAAGVTLDSTGNLFGTTTQGNVFELVKGTSTIKTLVSGVGAVGDVTLDSAGNLYGATSGGGAHGDGTIFKILKGTKAIQTLASFDGSNGAAPSGGVALDSSGNLFGTAGRGGAADVGTAFEILKGTSTIKTLASFTGANGAHPQTITLDAAGNVYGTTHDGGDWNVGTVFRIAKGTGTIETLLSFVFDNGAYPSGAVRLDSAGNLYGTTSGGGLGNNGTAYELSPVTSVTAKVVVNSLQDVLFPDGSGTVSLRNAVAIANASSALTTISFDPVVFAGTKTITLNGRDFELSNKSAAVTIAGPGANRLTINANDRSRIFRIDVGVTATISGLTLTNGNVYSIPMNNFDASGGGAIRNDGTLNLSNTFINANRAGQAGGGGLYNKGIANVINCTISNSHADTPLWYGGDGGGVEDDGPTLNLTNVTLAGNSVNNTSYGGGINFGERQIVKSNIKASLVNCTIVNNVASASYNGGGGLATPFYATATVTIANSIIANNSLFGNAQAAGVDVRLATSTPSVLISRGHNLIGKADGSSGWTATDRTGTLAKPLNPKLSALGNNGGPMQTIMPLGGSPAIDAGGNALIPSGVTSDQRGMPRIFGNSVDIGADEYISLALSGSVFNDKNGDGIRQSNDPSLANWQVYIDLNNIGYLVAGDPVATTNSLGNYTLTYLPTSTKSLIVREVRLNNWRRTRPAGIYPLGYYTVSPTAGSVAKLDFGNSATALVIGTVFRDANANGKLDTSEAGLSGWTLRVDYLSSSGWQNNKFTVTTDTKGNYSFVLSAGTYRIHEVVKTGFTPTKPAASGYTITLGTGATLTGENFGNK